MVVEKINSCRYIYMCVFMCVYVYKCMYMCIYVKVHVLAHLTVSACYISNVRNQC